jgi:sulfatase maturation enzyme AslB (radical SAM superfamily)
MTGATAGSAILFAPRTHRLHTITLTVNNSCNLECPNCYLQYDARGVIDEAVADRVLSADYMHLALVGKEPTLVPGIVAYLVEKNHSKGRTSSLITNGTRLNQLSRATLSALSYADVSFDGGPKTYNSRRGADFAEIVRNVHDARRNGLRMVHALHTIYAQNIDHIDDMMCVDMAFRRIVFSLYAVPLSTGTVSVDKADLKNALSYFRKSDLFMNSSKSILLLSAKDADYRVDIRSLVKEQGLQTKTRIIDDPLKYGFIRVTFDGKVLSPYDALHPLFYDANAKTLQEKSLNDHYLSIRGA